GESTYFHLFHSQKYYVMKNFSRAIRYIVYENPTNLFIQQLERILITKILISEFYIESSFKPDEEWVALSDFILKNKFESYEIKKDPKERKQFCESMFIKACEDFAKIICCPEPTKDGIYQYLQYFYDMLGNDTEGKYLEKDAEAVLRQVVAENGGNADAFVSGLREIVRNAEVGGDLDTIASNTLYGYWAICSIPLETGDQPIYGRDFEFDFMNYHDGMLHLNARHQNCDFYIPDFPIDAIPKLKDDIEALMQYGNYVVRFDDHHPYSKESKEALDELLSAQKIGFYRLSGPMEGSGEQPKEIQKCGADLVYEGMIKDTEIDSPVWNELTRLAHMQDLHIQEEEMAINLSKLIGSKHSKLDMVQQLMQMQTPDDLTNILQITGWGAEIKKYEDELAQSCPRLEEGMGVIDYSLSLTPENKEEYFNSMSAGKQKITKIFKMLTFGLVDLTSFFHKYDKNNIHRILLVLSPYQSSKEAKINVASTIHYFKPKFHFDYIFFCYGLSLMTTRKVNENDKTLDLNELAGKIGTDGDGGHAEAATCKPSGNKFFPHHRFKRVNTTNFGDYVKYIAMRLAKDFKFQIVRAEKMPPKFYEKQKK
ncbi:MAG TPA: hypothetical protein PLM75_06510, partial [bacterium]|nr:hypothetical protein [bacterium]